MAEIAENSRKASGASARRAARLLAVQALYQMDIRGGTPDATILEFIEHRTGEIDDDETTVAAPNADRAFFADIVRGVAQNRPEIDAALDGSLDGGSTARLEPLLRAILAAGVYELRSRSDVPARVAISGYVHLTDAFFDAKEPGLVNAVLDRLARVLRPDETRPAEATANGAPDQ